MHGSADGHGEGYNLALCASLLASPEASRRRRETEECLLSGIPAFDAVVVKPFAISRLTPLESATEEAAKPCKGVR